MKSILSLSGDFKGLEIIAYVNHPSVSHDGIDGSKLDSDTVFCRISDAMHFNCNNFKIAKAHDGTQSFLWVDVKSIHADPKSISSNIDITTTYSFTFFQWTAFYAVLLWRKVKNKWGRV
jgi:hypothetical protein